MHKPDLPFRRIRPRRVSDEVFDQIRELILSGRLKPGDRLPPERELAERLGVSRPVVREAISRLAAKGYLENIRGSGTYVLSITGEYVEEGPIHDFLKRGAAILPQVVEVRKIFETWSAATAAVRATEEEIGQMEEYLGEMEDAMGRGELGHTADANFHLSISYATHNPLLIHLMDSIYNMIERVTYEIGLKTHRDPEGYRALFQQHQAIFQAIRSRDPEMAYIKMMEHMIYVEREIKEIVGARDTEEAVYPFVKGR